MIDTTQGRKALLIDVADFQPDDMTALVGAGVDAVLIKVSEGLAPGPGNGFDHAHAKAVSARACGLAVLGGYDFAHPGNTPPAEAAVFAGHLTLLGPVHAAMWDMEAIDHVTGEDPPGWLEQAGPVLAGLTGLDLAHQPVYAGIGYAAATGFARHPALTAHPLIVPDYFNDRTPNHPWPIVPPWPAAMAWQYTSDFPVAGWPGVRVDASVAEPGWLASLLQEETPMWLVKADADGPQPVYLSDGIRRRRLTELAPAGRGAEVVTDAWNAYGGAARMTPPAGAKTEQFAGAVLWRIEPALLDAIAGPLDLDTVAPTTFHGTASVALDLKGA